MEFDEKRFEPSCPIVDIDGYIANGKQYDLDITLAQDNRDVIYGIVRNCFKDPVKDAVVKLVEIDYKMGKKELKPVSHTFTDDDGEFVFGPLCPGKKYSVQVWANSVDHVKICAKCHREGRCLQGVKLECDCKTEFKSDYDYEDIFPCKKEENMKNECDCNKKDDCEKDDDKKPNCPPKKDDNCGCKRY